MVTKEKPVFKTRKYADTYINHYWKVRKYYKKVSNKQNRKYEVGYSYFEGLNFDDASYEDVFARVAKSIKPLFVVSFVLGAYQSGIFSSFIFF